MPEAAPAAAAVGAAASSRPNGAPGRSILVGGARGRAPRGSEERSRRVRWSSPLAVATAAPPGPRCSRRSRRWSRRGCGWSSSDSDTGSSAGSSVGSDSEASDLPEPGTCGPPVTFWQPEPGAFLECQRPVRMRSGQALSSAIVADVDVDTVVEVLDVCPSSGAGDEGVGTRLRVRMRSGGAALGHPEAVMKTPFGFEGTIAGWVSLASQRGMLLWREAERRGVSHQGQARTHRRRPCANAMTCQCPDLAKMGQGLAKSARELEVADCQDANGGHSSETECPDGPEVQYTGESDLGACFGEADEPTAHSSPRVETEQYREIGPQLPNASYRSGMLIKCPGYVVVRKEESMDPVESALVGTLPPGTQAKVLALGSGCTGKRIKISADGVAGWVSVISLITGDPLWQASNGAEQEALSSR